jgi:hypothetical protein
MLRQAAMSIDFLPWSSKEFYRDQGDNASYLFWPNELHPMLA